MTEMTKQFETIVNLNIFCFKMQIEFKFSEFKFQFQIQIAKIRHVKNLQCHIHYPTD